MWFFAISFNFEAIYVMRKIPSKTASFIDIWSAVLFKFYHTYVCTRHDLMHVSESLPGKHHRQKVTTCDAIFFIQWNFHSDEGKKIRTNGRFLSINNVEFLIFVLIRSKYSITDYRKLIKVPRRNYCRATWLKCFVSICFESKIIFNMK